MRVPAKADDLALSFQMNPNRTPERNKYLITKFVRKRTKARRRYWVGTPVATYL
jgi:hypothetical protein